MARMRKVNLDIIEEGTLEEFLGVNIDRKKDGTIHLTQLLLIDSILKDLNLLGPLVKTKDTPACSSIILKRHSDSEPFDNSFKYRSVIGKLSTSKEGVKVTVPTHCSNVLDFVLIQEKNTERS